MYRTLAVAALGVALFNFAPRAVAQSVNFAQRGGDQSNFGQRSDDKTHFVRSGDQVNVAQSQSDFSPADLPPNARVGECYSRVFVPARFMTQTDQVLSKASTERLEILPAQFETVTEQVMVKPETARLVEVPAVYGWEDEVIETAAARTEWQKIPCDPNRRTVDSAGECLCLVEVPARHQTVRRRVVTQPASTREVMVPAEYRTFTRTVQVRPAQERRIPISAEYTTVSRQVQVSDAEMRWQILDCRHGGPAIDARTTTALQRTLQAKGYDPGQIDGVYGPQTRDALLRFQRAEGLPNEGLCNNTRRALGLN